MAKPTSRSHVRAGARMTEGLDRRWLNDEGDEKSKQIDTVRGMGRVA